MVVSFLSDYGLADDFVGVCHGVMRICPQARMVDVSHGIARHDLRAGALTLRRALAYLPPGVHLAVVDPEVGGRRRAVAVRVAEEDRLLVGPDNGLLSLAAARFGGVVEAVDVGRSPHRLEPVSATLEATHASTFADVPEGEMVLYEDAHRTLSLAVNRGSAAVALGVGLDAELRVREQP